MEAALNKIVGLVASRSIPLTGVNGTLDKVAVSAKDAKENTVEIMQDTPNGWSFTSTAMTAIILNGTVLRQSAERHPLDLQFIYTDSSGTICIRPQPRRHL